MGARRPAPFLVLLLLLVPVGPAQAARGVGIVSSSVPVARGYRLLLVAGGKSVDVLLAKRRRGSAQIYEVSAHGGTSTEGRALGVGRVSADNGRFGRIRLTFRPTGALRRVRAPRGCRVLRQGRSRTGVLVGSLRVRIGSHVVRLSRLPAQAIRGARLTCPISPGRPSHGLFLSAFSRRADQPAVAFSQDRRGPTTELVTLRRTTEPATLLAFVSAVAPRSAFTAAASLSSARARAAGPYLRGALSFVRGILPLTGPTALGTITGFFSAGFELLGTQRLPVPAQGALSRTP